MARSWMSAVWFIAAATVSSTCSSAEVRPVAPGWQELTIAREKDSAALTSRIDSDAISLKLGGGQVEVLRADLPIFSVDKLEIWLDHMALVGALRGKPADAALTAYRDFIIADLQKHGWKEVATERAKFSAGGNLPAIYWALQAEGSSGGKTAKLTLGLAAAVAGSSIVAMTGLAEDVPSVPAVRRILTDTLATLEAKKGTALSADVVARLRQEAQRLVYRMASRVGVILLNDELASQQDRDIKGDTQKFVLSPSDMANAAAAAVAGSPNGPFMTFLNDGRSQHTILVHAYDPATQSFEYSDTTGNRSMLEAGNNLAGVEAVRKPNTTDRLWVVKKDQLKTVLSGMIVGGADLLAMGRKMHLGPLGTLGNTPDEAKQTDFFKFFHLEETGKSAGADGGTTISYAPNAPKYRALVTVRLQLAQGGWLQGAQFVVKRRFIEDPREATSARDITKSFIEVAAMPADWTKIHRLHDEIFYLGPTKMMVSDSAAKNIVIPLLPTDGYQVFAGRRGHFVDMLSRSRLWLENIVADGEPALLVSIGAGD
jgi:hypothetical protein